jgi:hypothetical protein
VVWTFSVILRETRSSYTEINKHYQSFTMICRKPHVASSICLRATIFQNPEGTLWTCCIYRHTYYIPPLVHQIFLVKPSHPRRNPQKSYHIPPLKTVLLWRTVRGFPKIFYYPNTAAIFIVSPSCDTQILIIIPTL